MDGGVWEQIHFCRKSLWLSCETDNSIDWGHKKGATEKTEMRLANNFLYITSEARHKSDGRKNSKKKGLIEI